MVAETSDNTKARHCIQNSMPIPHNLFSFILSFSRSPKRWLF